MFKRVALLATVMAIVMAAGAMSVSADDGGVECPAVYNEDQGAWVSAVFCDGRLNAYDMTEPVAVYYTYELVSDVDDDGQTYFREAVSGIALWVVDGDGVGQLALYAPLSEITPAFSASHDVQIAAANGISLNYSPSAGAFWVAAPGYSYTWEAW